MEGRRLVAGENTKIDHINDLVLLVKTGTPDQQKESLEALLLLFNPLIHKLCGRWSRFFQDEQHQLISWDVIINEARFWFMQYTIDKYTIDGRATYNKFIKDHLLQRIRYIYECEIKYRKKLLFPDPDKHSYDEDDMSDDVHYRYGVNDMEGDNPQPDAILIDRSDKDNVHNLSAFILSALDDEQYFTRKEADMFRKCALEGWTHSQIGDYYGVSRTRISQIIGKVRKRLQEIALDKQEYWDIYEGE